MKKSSSFILALVLSNNVFALDKVTENVQAVCLSPSQQGKYWTVTAKGGAEANGSIRLITAGINGEATFTKGEWDGVQQVLKDHQAGDNESYRKCAEKLTPLFLEKFATAKPVAKSANTNKAQAKTVQKNQAVATKNPPTPAENSQNTQTIGTVTGSQAVIQNEVKGDANINFGK
jgi:hypothetical protein